jgi:hypothetical protein
VDWFNKKKIVELEGIVEGQAEKIQEMGDILTNKGDDSETKYRENSYNTYEEAVTEINEKYNGTADWGIWSGNIIDVRAAFIIGKGLKINKIDKSGTRELEWANEFFRINDLSLYLPSIFVTEAELEGKFLGRLFWDTTPEFVFDQSKDNLGKQKGMVKVRFWSWLKYKYKVENHQDDYLDYTKINYKLNGKEGEIKAPEFVYRKFGGRISDPNSAKPKIWGSLSLIDDVSAAFRDLREIDRLFGSPIPFVKVETDEAAKAVFSQLNKKNYKIKKMFVANGDFRYVSPDASGHQMIKEEIVSKIKAISGNTGVPVHFLGLPDLMSNRSTAENLMELIWASTKKEREIWESAFNEILEKAMIMWNKKSQMTPLDPMKVYVDIPEITSKEWEQLEKNWLPLYQSHAITLETLLEKIPELDIERELKRQKAEKKDELTRVKDEIDRINREKMDQNNPDNQNNNQNNGGVNAEQKNTDNQKRTV